MALQGDDSLLAGLFRSGVRGYGLFIIYLFPSYSKGGQRLPVTGNCPSQTLDALQFGRSSSSLKGGRPSWKRMAQALRLVGTEVPPWVAGQGQGSPLGFLSRPQGLL